MGIGLDDYTDVGSGDVVGAWKERVYRTLAWLYAVEGVAVFGILLVLIALR